MKPNDNNNIGPFPQSVFPPSVFPRRIFPWMGDEETTEDKDDEAPKASPYSVIRSE
jgi:hypothetical protein